MTIAPLVMLVLAVTAWMGMTATKAVLLMVTAG